MARPHRIAETVLLGRWRRLVEVLMSLNPSHALGVSRSGQSERPYSLVLGSGSAFKRPCRQGRYPDR